MKILNKQLTQHKLEQKKKRNKDKFLIKKENSKV